MEEDYKGETIIFGRRFTIKGRDDGIAYDTYDQATAAIDRRLDAAAKQARIEKALSLACLNAAGHTCTVKGVHASRNTLLGVTKAQVGPMRETIECYPDQPWLRALLIERSDLANRTAMIEQTLRRLRIDVDRRYHGGGVGGNYDDMIARLLTEHNDKMALAQREQEKRDAAAVGATAAA